MMPGDPGLCPFIPSGMPHRGAGWNLLGVCCHILWNWVVLFSIRIPSHCNMSRGWRFPGITPDTCCRIWYQYGFQWWRSENTLLVMRIGQRGGCCNVVCQLWWPWWFLDFSRVKYEGLRGVILLEMECRARVTLVYQQLENTLWQTPCYICSCKSESEVHGFFKDTETETVLVLRVDEGAVIVCGHWFAKQRSRGCSVAGCQQWYINRGWYGGILVTT